MNEKERDLQEDEDIEVGTDPEAVMDEMEHYSRDIDVQEDFDERQNMAVNDKKLDEELSEINHQSPMLSGGDLDAAWDKTDQAGEESVGGSAPTPDQDQVDEMGEALGTTYDEDELLDMAEKLGERDLNRWELKPESAQDNETNEISDDEEIELLEEEDELESLEEVDLEELIDLDEELEEVEVDILYRLDDEDLEDLYEDESDLLDIEDLEELDDEDDL